jgi:polyhydroxybutyrate depolymerase
MAAAELTPGDYEFFIEFDGLERSYELHVPPGYQGESVPLVLDFHGWYSNSSEQRWISGFLEKSDQEGFLVAWPQGWSQSWNAMSCCGEAMQLKLNDVGLAVAIVDAIAAQTPIDRTRVYATGLSNGGALSHLIGCRAADAFAAVAPVSFPLSVWADFQCQPSRPMPVRHFHGFFDFLVPYLDPGPSEFRSAPESFRDWASINDCRGRPTISFREGISFCSTHEQCDDDVEVTLCSIAGGHVLYQNLPQVSIPDLAWDFFQNFALEE